MKMSMNARYPLLVSAMFVCGLLVTGDCDAQTAPRRFPIVGFWMSPTRSYQWDARMRTYEPMIAAWKKAGANGILIADQEKSEAVERSGFAKGYRQRWYAGTNVRAISRLKEYLEDPAFRRAYDGLYFDEIMFTWSYDPGIPLVFEPFTVESFRMTMDSILDLCEKHRLSLALTAYALNGRPQFDSLYSFVKSYDERHRHPKTKRLTTSRLKNLTIFFSGGYFTGNHDQITDNLDSVAAWAQRMRFPMKNITLWQNPSCTFLRGDKLVTTPDCDPRWIEEQILYASQLKFGGIFFYLGDGVTPEGLDHILTGLWMTGNLTTRGKKRPTNPRTMRVRLADPVYRDGLLNELRKTNLPTHRGYWEWDK